MILQHVLAGLTGRAKQVRTPDEWLRGWFLPFPLLGGKANREPSFRDLTAVYRRHTGFSASRAIYSGLALTAAPTATSPYTLRRAH